MLVKEMPSPRLRAFTTAHPLNDMFEMGRFLRLLGDQKLQLTLRFSAGREVSWVLEAARGEVRYVDCIAGHVDDATVSLNVDLRRGSPSPAAVVKQSLADNAGWPARLNLARFVLAAAAEVGACLAHRKVEDVRHRLRTIRDRLETEFAGGS